MRENLSPEEELQQEACWELIRDLKGFLDNIEENLGKIKFIIFYLLTGGFAALSQALLDINSITPMIGASGAIAGVLGAYLVLFPKAKIKVPMPTVPPKYHPIQTTVISRVALTTAIGKFVFICNPTI